MHEKHADQLLLLNLSDVGLGTVDPNDVSQTSTDLSSRREMVNLMDAEPLLDYLVQNGVLSADEKDDILNEDDSTKQNLLLLRSVETRPNGAKLFTNVLRQTGQHYLANLVDDGIRIKALSGSGYLSKSRHKGQIGLNIRVKSMKLKQPTFRTVSELLHKDWISLEDIQTKLSSIKKLQSQSQRSSMVDRAPSQRCSYAEPAVPLAANAETAEPQDEKGCCFCCCVSRKRKSTKKNPESALEPNGHDALINTSIGDAYNSAIPGGEPPVEPGSVIVTCQPTGRFSSGQEIRLSYIRNGRGSMKQRENSVENLRKVANSIQEKCTELYAVLSDSSATVYSNLLRYLEQERGVLTLSTNSSDFLEVLCICTKPDHITQLQADSASGKLTEELEKILTGPEILQPLGISGVKLDVEVCKDDLEVAKQELV